MIAIHAAGAMTPVGLELADTMASLYTRVQLVADLDVLDSDGEPLSGMKIPFTEELDGPARITAMAHAVVDEATLSIEPSEKVPLILCCPEAAAFVQAAADFPAQLLSEVIAECAIPLDRTRSRIIPRGRAGTLEALGAALALLKDPSIPYCLVGGVDSFVDAGRVEKLVAEGRLITESNKDGFIAGEAGVMLLLTDRPDSEAMAAWLGSGAGSEEASRGTHHPITGTGLQEAMSRALAQAKLPFFRSRAWRMIFLVKSGTSRNCSRPSRACPRQTAQPRLKIRVSLSARPAPLPDSLPSPCRPFCTGKACTSSRAWPYFPAMAPNAGLSCWGLWQIGKIEREDHGRQCLRQRARRHPLRVCWQIHRLPRCLPVPAPAAVGPDPNSAA
jgi:hypothetical protein